MRKKILVSGVGFSKGGVGRLMEKLGPEAKSRGYTVLSRRMVLISQLIGQKKYFQLFYELILRLASLIVFKFRTIFVKGDVVLILHPQSIGYKTFIRLIKNNSVYFYVMDSSFFCMMSYNYDDETSSECLRCIGNPRNSMTGCKSWPALVRKKAVINYLDSLSKYSGKIVFLAQTGSQKKLLKEHFGADIDCRVVGMEPGDLSKSAVLDLDEKTVESKKYDLVYHGSLHPAKGLFYFLRLSSLLPKLKIFIPVPKNVATSLLGCTTKLEHVVFEECTWETGLMEAVQKSRLVVNPSLWSAPVEGAFLKSLAYNGNVAVVESQFGFSQELANKDLVLTLSNDPVNSARMIEDFLERDVNNRERAIKWLRDFYETNKTQNIFDSIDRFCR